MDFRFQAIADALLDHANTERAKLGLGPAEAKYLPWMMPAEFGVDLILDHAVVDDCVVGEDAFDFRPPSRFSDQGREVIRHPDRVFRKISCEAIPVAFVEQFWHSTAVVEMDLVSDEIIIAGDWAFERHTEIQVTAPTSGEGEPATYRFKGIWLLRRQTDGSWKIARYIWNFNPAPN